MLKSILRLLKSTKLKFNIFLAMKICSLRCKRLIIREGTTDKTVFRNIFVFKELKLPIRISPKFIVDGGAYTGLSTLYYCLTYPNAKIFAIEPESSNFKVLEEHTKELRNVTITKSGLWHKAAFLKIVDRNTGKWGFALREVSELDDYDVKSITMHDVLEESGFSEIDILKLDIEGSEKVLFSNNCESWIRKVNIIVIELHDRIIDGCTESFYSAVDINKWKEYRDREKVILVRKELL